jgi:glycosyltransferase involved in cell wall biosynthesis
VRVAVVIPALNEAESLPAVLADLHGHRVIVADNGSTDETAAIARAAGAEVVRERRRGYGSAVQAGLRVLESDPPEAVVILDADHADDPRRIDDLVTALAHADLALSARRPEPGALTPSQRFGNALAVRLIALATGHRYQDLGPFRAIRWEALERLEMHDPTWGWNVEMQMKAVQRGLRVVEVPLPYRARRGGQSKISGTVRGSVRAGFRIVAAVARYRE